MTQPADAHAPFQACKGAEPYLFISYAHVDKALVYPIIAAWHAAGYRIWYDEGIDPGNEWPDEVARALAECARFVVFVTPRSVASINVRNEIHFALNRSKPFLAVHLEETVLPDGLALRMGDIQAIMKYRMGEADFARKTVTVIGEPPTGAIPAIDRPAETRRPDAAAPVIDGGEGITTKRVLLIAAVLFLFLRRLGYVSGSAVLAVPFAPYALDLYRRRRTLSPARRRLAVVAAVIAALTFAPRPATVKVNVRQRSAVKETAGAPSPAEAAARNATATLFLSDVGWMGAGALLDDQGHVAACHSVLGNLGGSSEVVVAAGDGGRRYVGRLAGRCPSAPLTLLKLEGYSPAPAPCAPGDPASLKGGDVLTVGGLTTLGGATSRSGLFVGIERYDGVPMIRVLLAFTPLESGAPLVDAAGRIVGIAACASPAKDGTGLAYCIGDFADLLRDAR